MTKITRLRKEQRGRFPEFVEKWVKIGLSTERANRELSEKSIKNLYKLAKLKEPLIFWLPCPISGAISAMSFKKSLNKLGILTKKGSAVTSLINAEVYSAVTSEVDFRVDVEVDSAVGFEVRASVYAAVDSAIDAAVGSAVGSVVTFAAKSELCSEVGSAVKSEICSAVTSEVNLVEYSKVDLGVASEVGLAVDSEVGSAVDSAIELAVTSEVSSAVGLAVDSEVGFAVDSAVDSAVKFAVDSKVHSAGFSYIGGSLWAGYAAYYDYINEVLKVKTMQDHKNLVKSCGYYWCLEGIVFMTEKPLKINLDSLGRLHSFNEKAICYESGWGLYYIHGVKVPEALVLTPNILTKKEIDEERNAEVRRIMLNIYGAEKYLQESNAEVLDVDKDQFGRQRRLLRIPFDEESIVRVEVTNSSPELDETPKGLYKTSFYKKYFLPVHPELRPLLSDTEQTFGEPQKMTCHNAVASTFGKRGEEYGIEGQTRQGDVFIEFKDGSNKRKFRES